MEKEEIEIGDRVRQVKVPHPELGQDRYLGREGTVVNILYNPNMAVYGKGEEIRVMWDGYGCCEHIEYREDLEKI